MITFQNVSMVYPNGTVALRNVNLNINDGEFVFVVGRSGAGKTTLTKLLLCEEKISSGKLKIGKYSLEKIRKRKIPSLRRDLGVVFQDFRLFNNKTVYENIAFVLRVMGKKHSDVTNSVTTVLKFVELTDKADRFPTELSGGERQRVAFARALVNNPKVIIADEPTGNIDPDMSIELMDLLVRINKLLGKTVIVVTHERDLVDRYGKRVITIHDGEVVSDRSGGYAE